jgi:hypothetical protein
VIAKANIETASLVADGTSAMAPVESFVETPQAFSESLLVASRALPNAKTGSGAGIDDAGRPNQTFEAARAEGSIVNKDTSIARHHQQTIVSPATPMPPAPISNPGLIQTQVAFALPISGPVVSSNEPDSHGMDQERPAVEANAVSQSVEPSTSNAVSAVVSHAGMNTGGFSSKVALLNALPQASGWAGSLPAGNASTILTSDVASDGSSAISTGTGNGDRRPGSDGVSSVSSDGEKSSIAGLEAALAAKLGASEGTLAAVRTLGNESPKTPVAAQQNSGSSKRVMLPAAGSFGADSSTSDSVANQAAAYSQLGGEREKAGQLGLSGMKPSQPTEPTAKPSSHDVVKSSAVTNDATGTKEHISTATDQTGPSAVAQGQSTADKQGQNGASSQDQNAAPVQLNLAGLSVPFTSHGQISANVAPAQTGSTIAGRAGTAAGIPGQAVPVSTAAPQVSPVINTARLIQSMNQSEMRVGMRSTEFGNISINTLVAKGMISAQISVDHGELAKTIAAIVPEMQLRLGGNQGMNVRIELNHEGMGQGTGGSSGTLDSSADQSRSGRQQGGNSTSGYSGSGLGGRQFQPAADVMTKSEGRLNARLDIRV